MFMKTQGFKKLLKEAVAGGGLLVGNDGEGICLCGNCWVMWIKGGCIPKKELAAVIELAGEIPEPGGAFRVYKDGNQYEIMEGLVYNVMENAERCTETLDTTNIVIRREKERGLRVMQNRFGGIILIDERFIEVIDNAVLDPGSMERPVETAKAGTLPGVFWHNNIMALYVMPVISGKNENLIAYLERVQLKEMEINVPDVSETESGETQEEA